MLGKILITALNAVLPIVLLILLGYVLRRRGFLTEGFVKAGNKLVFRVCLPCMLFVNVYDISTVADIPWDAVIYCAAAVAVLFIIGMGVAVLTTKNPRRRGVIWQCCFRSNFAIIGLALAETLGGDAAVSVAAVIATLAIPMFNIFAVIALEVFVEDSQGRKHSPAHIALDILKNPLIIAVMLGLMCLLLRSLQVNLFGEVLFSLSRDTKFLYSVAQNLKAVTTPLALLVLGGQFQFSMVRGMFREIAVATVFRIVIAPLLGLGAAILLDRYTNLLTCSTDVMPAMLCLFGTPVAVSSAIMAAEMKNDEQLATQLVVWTSVGSVLTIFAFACILMSMGLIAV